MSPKSKEQNEVRRQKSIGAIKEVALELFAHNGYHSTSISQIAKAAGISKGLMYNYFSSKEDLLHTVVLELVELGNQMIEMMKAEEDPYMQLKKMTDASFEMIESNFHYWKLISSLAFQTDVLTELEPKLKEMHEVGTKHLTELFEKMGFEEPLKEAYFYSATMDGIFLHYLQLEELYPIKEMKEFILKRYSK